MRREKKAILTLGIVCLLGALALTGRNLWLQRRAEQTSVRALSQLSAQIPALPEYADAESDTPVVEMSTIVVETAVPDYVLNPEMEMPADTVDGVDYIGILQIPAISLELPVASEWSYDNLELTPCRYTGSAYQNDMVIMAHNYPAHFKNLKDLHQSDRVIFTDVDGNVFGYRVLDFEQLRPEQVENMTCGEWDLTLFTCTVGGQMRLAVRCVRERNE